MIYDDLKLRIESHPERDFGEGATMEQIEHAERELGLRILGSYRRFLGDFGWGGVGHIDIFGLGDAVPDHLNLVAMTRSERQEMRPHLPPYLLPVMNDGAGNLYCLDTRVDAREAPVVFWSHELGESQEPEQIASTFAGWLGDVLDRLRD